MNEKSVEGERETEIEPQRERERARERERERKIIYRLTLSILARHRIPMNISGPLRNAMCIRYVTLVCIFFHSARSYTCAVPSLIDIPREGGEGMEIFFISARNSEF